jgi:phytoene dehydrogenase-like protein
VTAAVVVGSGPNGLAAAVALARRGVSVTVLEAADEIGGGTRTSEAIVPGLLHDPCSAIHPMAVGSRFLRDLGLDRYGLEWKLPEIDCVHPLDDGTAGVLHRSVEQTAAGLGADGKRWSRLVAGPAASYDELSEDVLGPLLRVPSHPVKLARFGAPTTLPATVLARVFRGEQARALFGGVAAHAFQPLTRPLSSAIGLGIITAGHRHGWAVASGGSQSITNALASLLKDLGGTVETGVRVTTAADLPSSDVTLFDLAPGAVADILGDRLPPRVARGYRRFRHGPAAFKVDFAVEDGVPWVAEAARRAGTVHLGGSFTETVSTERAVQAGRMPGYDGDATEAIVRQVERFAPGFRDRVVGISARSAPDFAAYNENFVGGDILTGAKDVRQLVFGPRLTLRPYDLGIPGYFICSAATPPGPGAHGMCGAHAADRALRWLGIEE